MALPNIVNNKLIQGFDNNFTSTTSLKTSSILFYHIACIKNIKLL